MSSPFCTLLSPQFDKLVKIRHDQQNLPIYNYQANIVTTLKSHQVHKLEIVTFYVWNRDVRVNTTLCNVQVMT